MKAYELLDSPEKWCRGANAVAVDGSETMATSPYACKWCMEGAINRCCGPLEARQAALGRVRGMIGQYPVFAWNDAPNRTFEQVREALIRADV
jgi:hypothetical protein